MSPCTKTRIGKIRPGKFSRPFTQIRAPRPLKPPDNLPNNLHSSPHCRSQAARQECGCEPKLSVRAENIPGVRHAINTLSHRHHGSAFPEPYLLGRDLRRLQDKLRGRPRIAQHGLPLSIRLCDCGSGTRTVHEEEPGRLRNLRQTLPIPTSAIARRAITYGLLRSG